MNLQICAMMGVDFPLFAFSHCRDVVAAVSRAGGFGVFGGSTFSPEQLKIELDWIDAHTDGKPYGVDLAIPENMAVKEEGMTARALMEQIPQAHFDYTNELLGRHGVGSVSPATWARHGSNQVFDDEEHEMPFMPDTALKLLEESFRHPIKFIVNALGLPPARMFELARQHGVPVGATIGSLDHAARHLAAGVDVLIAQGVESAAHCGEISTNVLVTEVVEGIKAIRPVPVLAAGGIVTGRQMAAAMTLGAQGVWTGSVWLPTVESDVAMPMKERLLAARSRDTIRSRALTGKPARQLKSAWSDAWEDPQGPGPLPMPYQSLLAEASQAMVLRSVDSGNAPAHSLLTEGVGQGVGMLTEIKSAGTVVQEFKQDFADALDRMQAIVA